MKTINRQSGGYSAADVRRGADNHGHGCSKLYRMHQEVQERLRQDQRASTVAKFLGREERGFRSLYGRAETTLNAAVIDANGKIVTPAEAHAIREAALKYAGRYRRADGRWERIRQKKAVLDQSGEPIRDKNGKLVRQEACVESVKLIQHQAFTIHPVISLTLAIAAVVGGNAAAEALKFLTICAVKMAGVFEKHVGIRPILTPYHSKPLGGHFQPDYTLVNQDGRKVVQKKMLHLGSKMLGAWRWREMGFRANTLDLITGVEDSESGLDDALNKRGTGIDYKICREMDDFMVPLIRSSEFSELALIFSGRAEREYVEYLKRRVEAHIDRRTLLPEWAPENVSELVVQLTVADEIKSKVQAFDADSRRLVRAMEHVLAGGRLDDCGLPPLARERLGALVAAAMPEFHFEMER